MEGWAEAEWLTLGLDRMLGNLWKRVLTQLGFCTGGNTQRGSNVWVKSSGDVG